jgi:hypothetical protein
MSDDDKTPVDRKTTLDLVFERLDEISTDSKLALMEAREANELAGKNHEMLSALVRRSSASRFTRAILPSLAAALALLALLRTL